MWSEMPRKLIGGFRASRFVGRLSANDPIADMDSLDAITKARWAILG